MSTSRVGDAWRRPSIRAVAVAAIAAFAIAGCAGSYTQLATSVSDTTATVKGLVFSTEDATISYWFEYGPTKAYGSETPRRALEINDRDNHPVSEDLGGLDPGTTYHYRVCAKQPIVVCGNRRKFTTTGGASELSITADPALYPDFDPQIKDYVLDCAGGPVEMTVAAPADTEVAIDGGAGRNGSFTADVPLQPNQRFSFEVSAGGGESSHHVRCLPTNFPDWNFEKFGAAEQQWYFTTLNGYVIVFDGNGIPVWWKPVGGAVDAEYLNDGTLTWGAGNTPTDKRYEISALDGTLINTLKTVAADTDVHDIELLDNGNYLLMAYKPRANTADLTPYGGPDDATVIDAEMQEVEPDGDLVWDWNSKDHIELDETTQDWFDQRVLPNSADGYDIVHINSAEITSDGSMLVSMRHTNGIYKIDRTTGDVIWKLGGKTTAESLTVVDDPEAPDTLGGQHDARMHPDGTLTAFDNGETHNRPPRGVRFQIDESAGSATFLESVTDLPDVSRAICCGSARRSGSGSWLVSWGHFPNGNGISEFAPDGSRTFRLTFPAGFSYRTHPVPQGELSRADLRNGMDAQHPR